jgi:hypothetical protein
VAVALKIGGQSRVGDDKIDCRYQELREVPALSKKLSLGRWKVTLGVGFRCHPFPR